MDGRSRRVFISYAHESSEHVEAVRDLWILLRRCGIDATLDRTAAQRRTDWALWTADQVRGSDYILVIASRRYRRCAEGRAEPGLGRGAQWEARLIRDAFYADQSAGVSRFVPVVVPGQSEEGVPDFLAPATTAVYHIPEFTLAGAEPLLRLLSDQPAEVEPPLGRIPVLVPRAALLSWERSDVPVGDEGPRAPDLVWDTRASAIEMRWIPAGTVRMPTSWEQFGPEDKEVSLPAFSISRFPVTSDAYRTFLTDGSRDRRWWSDMLKPVSHGDLAFPVDLLAHQGSDALSRRDRRMPAMVTRYDAIAFTRWLSWRTGRSLTVPLDSHWVRAARGESRDRYPWGDDFDATRCHCATDDDDVFRRPTAVDAHPSGASRFGVEDLVGNTPEWVSLSHPDVEDQMESGLFHVWGAEPRATDTRRFRCTYREANTPLPEQLASFRLVEVAP